MKRLIVFNVMIVLALILTACGGTAATPTEVAGTTGPGIEGADQYGERYDADPAVLTKSVGTPDGVPQIALAALYRAGLPVDQATQDLAVKCWKEKICETGTGGPLTVALADGFGENFWRQMTHMEFILQALTYPEIGKIIYVTALGDTQRSISDFRSLIAQDVDIIIGFPDAGDALLPAVREATERDIIYITHSYGAIGAPGTDYPTFVAEDVCLLGQLFAETLNNEVGSGKVAFLGGTPGNALSAYWQSCEEPALSPDLSLVGRADTSWTREGTLEAVSGCIEQYGVPQALYTDWKTVYVRRPTEAERLAAIAPLTQFGRMCARLGIQIIPASSPQAKGRIERQHGTQQDRLIKKLRRAGITMYEAANAFVREGYLTDHNARFAQPAASAEDFHRRRPPTRALDRIFQLEETRTISKDWVVHYRNRLLQLARVSSRMPARSTVRVCEARNGQLTIRYRDRALAWQELIPGVTADSPAPLVSVDQRTVVVARRSAAAGPDHPWRQQRYVDMRSGSRSVWQAIRD